MLYYRDSMNAASFWFDCFNLYKMNEYPLSTVSSKKVKKSSSSLFQRSACQATAPGLVNKAEYCHILKGQRVFIELYYQGRVMETAYNQWIQFMGGTLYKRLNPKVTIFLTNSDSQELQAILDRVRRICPSCRVISILWFQRCFQTKNKVPFIEFALDVDSKVKTGQNQKNKQQQEKLDLTVFDGFITNITQDLEAEFREFFKNKQNSFFEYLPKNASVSPERLMKAQEFDLGPNPHKKKDKEYDNHNRRKQKPAKLENDKKRRRTSIRKVEEKTLIQKSTHMDVRQTKSLENRQNLREKKEQLSQEQTKLSFQHPPQARKQQGLSFNTMMQKYLSFREESRKSQHKQQSQHTSIKQAKRINKESTFSQANHQDSQKLSGIALSKHSFATQRTKGSKIDPKFPYSFNKKHTYEDKSQLQLSQNLQFQLEELGQKISSNKFNHLIVVSDSKNLSAKIEKVNQERIDNNEIYLQSIYYHIYVNYLNRSPPKHTAYYLFNPRRVLDRPLYFALTCYSHHHPKLVSYKLIDEVDRFNKQIRSGAKDEQEIKENLNLRSLKQLTLEVNRQMLYKKKVVFLQSELPVDILQLIVKRLEAEWVSQNEYLMGRKPDVVATNRSSLPDSAFLTICQEDLWRKVFPLQNDKVQP